MVSKVSTCTKHAALSCEPLKLTDFAETNTLSDNEVSVDEHHSVKTWVGARSKSQATTFNQLRHGAYLDRKNLTHLSPTSSVIHGHIRHIFCGIRNALNLLNRGYSAPNPEVYWWENDNGALP